MINVRHFLFTYITQTLHKGKYLFTNGYKGITFEGNIVICISLKTAYPFFISLLRQHYTNLSESQ